MRLCLALHRLSPALPESPPQAPARHAGLVCVSVQTRIQATAALGGGLPHTFATAGATFKPLLLAAFAATTAKPAMEVVNSSTTVQ